MSERTGDDLGRPARPSPVFCPDFSRSARLPEGEEVAVEFTPDKPGEYGFQCQMGMLRGKVIVE